MPPTTTPKTILITGASSGLGRGLAYAYAAEYAKKTIPSAASGPILNLGLCARRVDELELVKSDIEKVHKHVRVEVAQLDVTKYSTVPTTLDDLSKRLGQPYDVVVVNAGVGNSGRKIGASDAFEHHQSCVETNVLGAMAVINAAVKEFKQSKRGGQIVGISSVASHRGLPTSSAYSASKAALDTYLDALRVECYNDNISVTTIHPGYVDTPINKGVRSKPFLVTVEKAAPQMRTALIFLSFLSLATAQNKQPRVVKSQIPRIAAGAVAVNDRVLYIGGYPTLGIPHIVSNTTVLNEIQHLSTHITVLDMKNLNVTDVSVSPPEGDYNPMGVMGASCRTSSNGQVYCFGGNSYNGPGNETDAHWNWISRLDATAMRWTFSTNLTDVAPRRMAASSMIGDSFYLFGGEDARNRSIFGDLIAFNTTSSTHKIYPPANDAPSNRINACMFRYSDTQFILYGGLGTSLDRNQTIFHNDLYIFDTIAATWRNLTDLSREKSEFYPSGRMLHSCTRVGDRLIAYMSATWDHTNLQLEQWVLYLDSVDAWGWYNPSEWSKERNRFSPEGPAEPPLNGSYRAFPSLVTIDSPQDDFIVFFGGATAMGRNATTGEVDFQRADDGRFYFFLVYWGDWTDAEGALYNMRPPRSRMNFGAIGGGVAGGFAVLGVVFAAWTWWKRRSSRKDSLDGSGGESIARG
ncbi:hypothetical protein HK097_010950 [Rhizophlyctis rosea]|uniref:Uncharacterized protein n=1 Tax=Rhizophlyctis rosea TaxID=64517 RepID=A0AAD5X7W5_9FUNG|nr:hypothetical protein HK097_010950 [Rhizophlyctis rosea]